MRKVYTADHTIDAHIVKGLLEQHGIPAWVQGHYLQGGIGELPAAGLLTVWVDDPQEPEALRIVREYLGNAEAAIDGWETGWPEPQAG